MELLAVAEDLGAYLMEWLHPGHAVTQLSEEGATRVLAQQLAVLADASHTNVPAAWTLPHLATWFADLERFAIAPPADLDATTVQRAHRLANALMAKPSDERLLHGDFHHDNVLAHGDGWRAIDPKGLLGDPAYECAALFRNRLHDVPVPELADVLCRRLAVLAETTGFDAQRIAGWAYVETVQSTVWSAQAGQRRDVPTGMAVAAALLPLIGEGA